MSIILQASLLYLFVFPFFNPNSVHLLLALLKTPKSGGIYVFYRYIFLAVDFYALTQPVSKVGPSSKIELSPFNAFLVYSLLD